jgi:hypothetical protein
MKSDVLGDSVKLDTFTASAADELSGRHFATCPIICAMVTPLQILMVLSAWLTSKSCISKSRLAAELLAATPDVVVVRGVVVLRDDDDAAAEPLEPTATTPAENVSAVELLESTATTPVPNTSAVDWKYDPGFPYTAAHEERMRLALKNELMIKAATVATPELLQLLTPEQLQPLEHEHKLIVASVSEARVSAATSMRAVSCKVMDPLLEAMFAEATQDTALNIPPAPRASTAAAECAASVEPSVVSSSIDVAPAPTVAAAAVPPVSDIATSAPTAITASVAGIATSAPTALTADIISVPVQQSVLSAAFDPASAPTVAPAALLPVSVNVASAPTVIAAAVPPGSVIATSAPTAIAASVPGVVTSAPTARTAALISNPVQQSVLSAAFDLTSAPTVAPAAVLPVSVNVASAPTVTAAAVPPVSVFATSAPTEVAAATTSVPVTQSVVPTKPFNVGDRVILTVAGNPLLTGVKGEVVMTNLRTNKHPGTKFLRVKLYHSEGGSDITSVKTRVTNVVHDTTVAKEDPKPPATPTKQTKRSLSTPNGPRSKRRATGGGNVGGNVDPVTRVSHETVCHFGEVPRRSSRNSIVTHSALLVPFIHAVANKISSVTHELPRDDKGKRVRHFRFNYTIFPIRDIDPAEFDSLVDDYASEFVALGFTRTHLYSYCDSNGYIGSPFQLRLTDPLHDLSLVEQFPSAISDRLARLSFQAME